MLSSRLTLPGLACALGMLAAACAPKAPSAVTPQVAAESAPAVAQPAAPAEAPPDPAAQLIALSAWHFEAGRHELELGHLLSAKGQFNRALEVLLESPFGARSDPGIRDHFEALVERISAYEMTALAQGDGFEEQRYESATIDEILAISTFEIPDASAETMQAVTADLESTVHDIDIPLNARVLAFVQLFAGRLRSFLEQGLSRGVQYLPMIQTVFRAEGLPLDLAYVPLIESAFKPTAVSRAQAKGIWQFMRATGLENGLKHDWYIDERAEPEKSTRAAARYLKTLRDMFDGDWHLALASYNGGPGRVQRAIKQSGRKDFWRLAAVNGTLPRETRDYVPLILAAIIVARNPAQYGLNIEPVAPPRWETVTLPTAVDLRRVAEWVGEPVQKIQELNPELRRWTTPVHAPEYDLKVPEGTADMVRAHLAEADADELASLNWHTVKKGETLLSIARNLKVTRADLAEANYLSSQARLSVGQRLVIPRAPAILLTSQSQQPPATAARPAAAIAGSGPAGPSASSTIYRVKRGDTLFAIARLHGTTVASLKTWNRLRTDAIQVGQRLTIFLERTTATN